MNDLEELRQRLLARKREKRKFASVEATLVVVDMQTLFPATQSISLLESVESLITQAFTRSWGVVLLEHAGYGATDRKLLSLLSRQSEDKLANCAIATKQIWDGSRQVASVCTDLKLPTGKFYVCGVNTFECVQDTVIGLSSEFSSAQINVVQSACNCETSNPWSAFPVSDKLRLITEL